MDVSGEKRRDKTSAISFCVTLGIFAVLAIICCLSLITWPNEFPKEVADYMFYCGLSHNEAVNEITQINTVLILASIILTALWFGLALGMGILRRPKPQYS